MTKYILFPLRACDMIPPSIDDQITSRGLINCARTVDGRRKVLLCYVSSPVIAIVLFCQRFVCLYVFLPLSSLYASVHAISNSLSDPASRWTSGMCSGATLSSGRRLTCLSIAERPPHRSSTRCAYGYSIDRSRHRSWPSHTHHQQWMIQAASRRCPRR